MAFATGTATSLDDLLAALQGACVANGYTLTGNVLSKGTLFARVVIVGNQLAVDAGSGQTSGALTGVSDVAAARMGITTSGTVLGASAFTFPMTYFVHIAAEPDEVYMVVNLNGTQYQYIAFGQSSVQGLVGTGTWFAATTCELGATNSKQGVDVRAFGGFMQSSSVNAGLFQGLQGQQGKSQNGAVDHQLDSATWVVDRGAYLDAMELLLCSPSGWNGESVLAPVTVYTGRPSGFVSVVAELAHARFVMLDNLADRQVITLGHDRWMVYPWWRRSKRYTNGQSSSSSVGTGTYGHAIRYDGP